MKYTVRMTDLATNDLLSIARYIAQESQSATIAENVAQKIIKTAELLSDTPHLGRVPKSRAIRLRGYRVLICDVYLLFYRADEQKQTIVIHRILHAKQDYLKLI